MILIIKSTHSLSTILITDRSNGWWATPNSSPFSLIIRMIRAQFTHSHDNEYNRFKREGFMMEYSSDPTDQLSHSLFSTQWSDFNTPSLTIPFVSLIHPILSCYEGQVAIRFNPYESLSYQHSSLLSSLWLWDITIVSDYPLWYISIPLHHSPSTNTSSEDIAWVTILPYAHTLVLDVATKTVCIYTSNKNLTLTWRLNRVREGKGVLTETNSTGW